MVIDSKWVEFAQMEIQQQARDHAMQARGAMTVIEALIKRLNEPEPPAEPEAQPADTGLD